LFDRLAADKVPVSQADLMELYDASRKIGDIFDKVDTNNDGTVALAELKQAMEQDEVVKAYLVRVFGSQKVTSDPDVLFRWLDSNQDGAVDPAEFEKGITSLRLTAQLVRANSGLDFGGPALSHIA